MSVKSREAYTKAKSRKHSARHAVQRMSKSQRLKELLVFVQLCFQSLDEPDFKEIANKSGLSLSTIHRLANGEATLCTRFGTVQALGYASGLAFELTDFGAAVRLVD